LQLEEVAGWAIHPGGPRILDAVESALSLSHEKVESSRTVLRNHGNMSSPTVAFVLNDSIQQNPQMANCVVLGFGPGLSVEAMLLFRTPMDLAILA
jgi:predicted naringenin-chalcone synthase